MKQKPLTKKTGLPRTNSPVTVLSPVGRAAVVDAQINLRAYQLYAARGREPGHELEDWLLAEAEVMRQRINKMAM